jgi:hypothetical protein
MKTLDLNAYGVSEMEAAEMQNLDGGCALCDIIDAVGDFIKGWLHQYDK